ncbi:MAG TPA: hypothetical protein VD997_10565 [Phycisphaerales bacterium]|nr:hypothetical protein [Phycisphaerales bacterium]
MHRTAVTVGCLTLALLAGGARAQTPQTPPQDRVEKPRYDEAGPRSGGRSPMPTKRVYEDGLQRRLFPSGFKRIAIPSTRPQGFSEKGGRRPLPRMIFVREPVVPNVTPRRNDDIIGAASLSDTIRANNQSYTREYEKVTRRREVDRKHVLSILRDQERLAPEALIEGPAPRNCNPSPCSPCQPRKSVFKESEAARPSIGAERSPPKATDAPAASTTTAALKLPLLTTSEAPRVQLTDANAEASLREHVKANPDDFRARRDLALAELNFHRPADAARTIAAAYASDPLLAREPMNLAALGLDDTTSRSLATLAHNTAIRANTSDTWLLVIVLRQAQGQLVQAIAACDKAEKAGLDAALVGVFRHSMSR